ncbi:MAG: hypothetical protein Q8P15_03160 [Nanoarchaeota archaeon]|nr:hypothetical protein [Nanoarchaeota archaeon]
MSSKKWEITDLRKVRKLACKTLDDVAVKTHISITHLSMFERGARDILDSQKRERLEEYVQELVYLIRRKRKAGYYN